MYFEKKQYVVGILRGGKENCKLRLQFFYIITPVLPVTTIAFAN